MRLQVREELPLHEGGVRARLPALPAVPAGGGGAADPEGPRAAGPVPGPAERRGGW